MSLIRTDYVPEWRISVHAQSVLAAGQKHHNIHFTSSCLCTVLYVHYTAKIKLSKIQKCISYLQRSCPLFWAEKSVGLFRTKDTNLGYRVGGRGAMDWRAGKVNCRSVVTICVFSLSLRW